MEELNAILTDLAQSVSETSGSSISNDDNNQANDHERGKPMKPSSGPQDVDQSFKVYSGYGGDYNSTGSMPGGGVGSNGSNGMRRPSTGPGTVQSWPEASATWTSTAMALSTTEVGTAMAMVTVKPTGLRRDVWSATSRTALATPREIGDCGRKHKRDMADWGPGKGWNNSTLPVYRSPSSPCNRLFGAIKDTRPGREPKWLLERLNYTPEPTPPRNSPAHLWLSSESWNSSTCVSAPPTHRQKPHSSREISSVDNDSSPVRRQWQQQQNVEFASTPSKNAGIAAKGRNEQQQQQADSKLSRVINEWKLSTRPQWKNTVKWNQFDNIKENKRPPRVRNRYTGVKAQYMKPSKKYLRLKKERESEAQRREDYRELDMKYCHLYHDRRARLANEKNLLEEIGRVVSSPSS